MVDWLSREQRSRNMASIQSKGNKTTERVFLSILRRARISSWRRHLNLPGKPDFVFRAEREHLSQRVLLAWLPSMLPTAARQPILLEKESRRKSPQGSPLLAEVAFTRMARTSALGTQAEVTAGSFANSCKS